jgi:nicotinamidase/pyrazinamidase
MSKALIVVDMQRGFLHPSGALFRGELVREIIDPIRELVLNENRGAIGIEPTAVFFTQDTHAPGDKEFDLLPPHCIRGSGEEDIIDELQDVMLGASIIRKRRNSAFFETDLAAQLSAANPDEIVVVGNCTDITVLHTVAGLRNRDYRVVVPADCVASYDLQQHEWGLSHIENILGAKITNR